MSYTIKNPYESVMSLIGNKENHYKTNLHTHSTYSDANDTMTDMIKGFYDLDFDIVAFAEHGILGKPWNEEPTHIPFFNFQYLWHGKRSYLTEEQYKAIKNGTYKTEKGYCFNILFLSSACIWTFPGNPVNGLTLLLLDNNLFKFLTV